MTDTDTAKPVTAILDAQGVLAPGQPGYWQIWGASVRDISVGDLLMVKWQSGEIGEYEVAEIDRSGSGSISSGSIIPTEVSTTGERFRVGIYTPFVLLRQGTHNTLSKYCR